MKIIIAHSKKYGNRNVYVDDNDFDALSKYHWIHSKNGYAITRVSLYPERKISMHRMILGLSDPKILCDHKDRDGLNNQRCNLRVATYGQNSQNKGVCNRNEAGLKGVVMNKENKFRRYCAIIIADGKRIFGGGFKTAVEAGYKWNQMARQYHGEFGYQNPISATVYNDGVMYTHDIKKPCSTPTRDNDFVIEKVHTFVKPYRKRT